MIEIGLVLDAPAPHALNPTAARMVQVELQPDGRVVDCRIANLGQGFGRGVFVAPAPGDEVLVLCPSGDPNRAVVLGGVGNGVSSNPVANDLLKLLLLHPGGVELRSADGLPAHGLVLGTLLTDLSAWSSAFPALLTALVTAIKAACTTATAVQLAAIDTALTALLTAPSLVTLTTQLAASAASGTPPGVGGPPYASALNKGTV